MTEFGESKFVGIAGRLNAGKDTAAEHLAQKHNFLHVSTGDLLREVARGKGLDTDRNTLIDLGIQLRADYGSQGALIIMAMEKWQEHRDRYIGGLVVTGMRAIGEAAEVPQRGGKLLFVEAPLNMRYRRMITRRRDSEARQAFQEFSIHDKIEYEGDPTDPTRPNLRAIKLIADRVLYNDDDMSEPFLQDLEYELGLSTLRPRFLFDK